MAECKHTFIGRSDGVHCTRCGIHMTAAEYAVFLKPKPERKKKTSGNGGEKSRE